MTIQSQITYKGSQVQTAASQLYARPQAQLPKSVVVSVEKIFAAYLPQPYAPSPAKSHLLECRDAQLKRFVGVIGTVKEATGQPKGPAKFTVIDGILDAFKPKA